MDHDFNYWKRLKELHSLLYKCTSFSAFMGAGTPNISKEEVGIAWSIYQFVAANASSEGDYDLALEMFEDMYTIIDELPF